MTGGTVEAAEPPAEPVERGAAGWRVPMADAWTEFGWAPAGWKIDDRCTK
jgi:hypothetical protein